MLYIILIVLGVIGIFLTFTLLYDEGGFPFFSFFIGLVLIYFGTLFLTGDRDFEDLKTNAPTFLEERGFCVKGFKEVDYGLFDGGTVFYYVTNDSAPGCLFAVGVSKWGGMYETTTPHLINEKVIIKDNQ